MSRDSEEKGQNFSVFTRVRVAHLQRHALKQDAPLHVLEIDIDLQDLKNFLEKNRRKYDFLDLSDAQGLGAQHIEPLMTLPNECFPEIFIVSIPNFLDLGPNPETLLQRHFPKILRLHQELGKLEQRFPGRVKRIFTLRDSDLFPSTNESEEKEEKTALLPSRTTPILTWSERIKACVHNCLPIRW